MNNVHVPHIFTQLRSLHFELSILKKNFTFIWVINVLQESKET
jgi:hypothetical protein